MTAGLITAAKTNKGNLTAVELTHIWSIADTGGGIRIVKVIRERVPSRVPLSDRVAADD